FPDKVEDCVATFEKNPALVGQLKTLMTRMDLLPGDGCLKLGLRLFYYVGPMLREYTYASALCEKLKSLVEGNKTSDPYMAAIFYSWYGDTKLTTHGLPAAIAEFKRAKVFFEQADPVASRYEKVMFLTNNLGYFVHWQGDLETAQACLDEAKALQGDHQEVFPLCCIEGLEAAIAMDRGQFERATQALDRELAYFQKDPIAYKVDGHFSRAFKAHSLLKRAQMKVLERNPQEARALQLEALALAREAYTHAVRSSNGQNDTEIVARTLVYLAQAQNALGQSVEAEKNVRKAIQIFGAEYGGAQVIRRQGVAHIVLGDALSGQGKHEEAGKAYLMAEEVFNKISTHKAFDDMSEVWARLVDNAIVRGDANTARRCIAAHKATFDGLHPRYIVMAAKVASV
ncbi:MAG: tetratricopeptide repeat protein, partial [Proteobacteria bacterium]|nr:tetratricopeptide repeat protein [Pseudomonadota bacterium]